MEKFLLDSKLISNDEWVEYRFLKEANRQACNAIDILVDILKEQPPASPEDLEWLEDRLLAIENILQVGGGNNENR